MNTELILIGTPFFSDLLMSGYLFILSTTWILMIISISNWGRSWKLELQKADDDKTKGPYPLLSICIPARNESQNIADAVTAALKTDWPNFELLVVDDRSDDRTAEYAIKAAAGDPRFRLISGVEPAQGWAGKPWACYRAAKEARGSWLLFIDADVRIHPNAAFSAMTVGIERDLALLSLFGSWTLESFWERALIPAVGWLIRGTVDFEKMNSTSHSEAFANGQFIMVQRSKYMIVDGHAAVKSEVLEDVRLAQAMKRAGLPVEIRPASWAFNVRLYRSFAEIVNGYTKNMYEGLGRNPIMGLGAALFLFVGSLLPLILLFLGLFFRFVQWYSVPNLAWLFWLGLIVVLQFVFRFRIERQDGRSGWGMFAQPLAAFMLIFILLRSTLKVKVSWKGREFVDGKSSV